MILRLAAHAMATRFEVVLAGAGTPERDLRAAGEAALHEIADCDRRLSRFRRDSLLAHIAAHAHERPIPLDADTFDLFRACLDAWRDTGGAFDITLGGRMEGLGFHRGVPASGPPVPDDPGSRMRAIELDPAARTIRLARPGVRLDLGAIAKGHALDLAERVLREAGVACALLHAGTSSVCAIGAPPGTRGWRVEIAPPLPHAPPVSPAPHAFFTPSANTDGVARGSAQRAVCVLRDRSLSVSAHHGRRVAGDRGDIGHVLDPRTGESAERPGAAQLAATVAESGRLAEAWSTALLVLGARPPAAPATLGFLLAWATDGGVRWQGVDPADEFELAPAGTPAGAEGA